MRVKLCSQFQPSAVYAYIPPACQRKVLDFYSFQQPSLLCPFSYQPEKEQISKISCAAPSLHVPPMMHLAVIHDCTTSLSQIINSYFCKFTSSPLFYWHTREPLL